MTSIALFHSVYVLHIYNFLFLLYCNCLLSFPFFYWKRDLLLYFGGIERKLSYQLEEFCIWPPILYCTVRYLKVPHVDSASSVLIARKWYWVQYVQCCWTKRIQCAASSKWKRNEIFHPLARKILCIRGFSSPPLSYFVNEGGGGDLHGGCDNNLHLQYRMYCISSTVSILGYKNKLQVPDSYLLVGIIAAQVRSSAQSHLIIG